MLKCKTHWLWLAANLEISSKRHFDVNIKKLPFFCSARQWVFKLDSEPGSGNAAKFFDGITTTPADAAKFQVPSFVAGVASKEMGTNSKPPTSRKMKILKCNLLLFCQRSLICCAVLFCFNKFNCIMQQLLLLPLAAYLKLKFIQICSAWSRFELSFCCSLSRQHLLLPSIKLCKHGHTHSQTHSIRFTYATFKVFFFISSTPSNHTAGQIDSPSVRLWVFLI